MVTQSHNLAPRGDKLFVRVDLAFISLPFCIFLYPKPAISEACCSFPVHTECIHSINTAALQPAIVNGYPVFSSGVSHRLRLTGTQAINLHQWQIDYTTRSWPCRSNHSVFTFANVCLSCGCVTDWDRWHIAPLWYPIMWPHIVESVLKWRMALVVRESIVPWVTQITESPCGRH